MLTRHVSPLFLIASAVMVVTRGSGCALAAAQPTADRPVRWTEVLTQTPAWYRSPEARRIADHVLAHQRDTGGWPKNIDMTVPPEPDELAAARARPDSTIDNGATVTQLRFLGRVYRATKRSQDRTAFIRGIDYLLAAQYPNGGWPQYYPLRTDYSRYITFNDDAMIGVVTLLSEVAKGEKDGAFVDSGHRSKARDAVSKATDVILLAQIPVDGKLTAWCAQHDELTLEPRKARAYEHPSLSGAETVGLVRFLMRIEQPDDRVIRAVEAAVAWLRSVRIAGVRLEDRRDVALPEGRDVVVVADSTAPSLWARFYEIGTNRPIFSGRDGVIRYELSQIDHERRIGYAWLGTWPQRLLEDEYPAWKKKHGGKGI
jgi:PelA/Pel-15E family pectate lyase